ncbi:hypothetical protein D3C76_1481710 [compost metagenome]
MPLQYVCANTTDFFLRHTYREGCHLIRGDSGILQLFEESHIAISVQCIVYHIRLRSFDFAYDGTVIGMA